MGLFLILLLPALLIFLILYVCRTYNFSLFPRGMKGRRPKPWKFPKVNKDVYKWEYSSDDDYPLDGSSSDSESSSDDDYVSVKDDPNLQRQIETNGSFYGLITPGGMKRHDLPKFKPSEIVMKPVERTPTFAELNPHNSYPNFQNKEQQVLDRLNNPSIVVRGTTRGRGRGRGRGTTRGRGRGRGKRNVSVYDPDLLDPTKEVRYIDEREYDSMVGADNPND